MSERTKAIRDEIVARLQAENLSAYFVISDMEGTYAAGHARDLNARQLGHVVGSAMRILGEQAEQLAGEIGRQQGQGPAVAFIAAMRAATASPLEKLRSELRELKP